MPPINDLLLFTAAAFVMNLSPGPSNFYVMARTIAQGATAGLVAVAGLAAGNLLHVLAAVLGLSVIFSYSPMAYTILKIFGAGYLIYLGLAYLGFHFPGVPAANESSKETPLPNLGKIFGESALIEVSNPKTALFYFALLPQFVAANAGPAAPQFLVLGLIVAASAIPCDLFVIFFADRAAIWIKGNDRVKANLDKVSGSILITLGAYVLLAEGD